MALVVDPNAPIWRYRTLLVDPEAETLTATDMDGVWQCPPSESFATAEAWADDRYGLVTAWTEGGGIVQVFAAPHIEVEVTA